MYDQGGIGNENESEGRVLGSRGEGDIHSSSFFCSRKRKRLLFVWYASPPSLLYLPPSPSPAPAPHYTIYSDSFMNTRLILTSMQQRFQIIKA